MNSPPRGSERLEQVLQVAGQLFARQGYHATSTREIARVADISENTLFRQFESKEQIFWEALRFRFGTMRPRRELLEGIATSQSPEVVLPQLLSQLVDTAYLNPDTLRLVAVAFLEFRWEASNVCADFLHPIFSAVKSYLKKNIEAGALRNVDPSMLTAALGVSVIAYPEIARILDGSPRYLENRDAIEAFSRFWLNVLLPDGRGSAKTHLDAAAPDLLSSPGL
jgi:AcrR family transcriptional regulator